MSQSSVLQLFKKNNLKISAHQKEAEVLVCFFFLFIGKLHQLEEKKEFLNSSSVLSKNE